MAGLSWGSEGSDWGPLPPQTPDQRWERRENMPRFDDGVEEKF
jgi:hypothetical protein